MLLRKLVVAYILSEYEITKLSFCLHRHQDDEDLFVQIGVFDEQKQNDDELMVTSDGFDMNNHLQVFKAVFDQVIMS